jgi:hypothetical protein
MINCMRTHTTFTIGTVCSNANSNGIYLQFPKFSQDYVNSRVLLINIAVKSCSLGTFVA